MSLIRIEDDESSWKLTDVRTKDNLLELKTHTFHLVQARGEVD